MFQFKEVHLKNESKEKNVLAIEFDNPEMAIVGEFLMTDVSMLDYSVLKSIDLVLSGESEFEESSGNRCSLEIKKDKVVIEDLFEGLFEDFETMKTYEIETQELRDLIIMWKNKLKSFNEES